MMELTQWTGTSAPDGARAQIEFVIGGKDLRLDSVDTANVRFEDADRVRAPGSWKHKRNYAGYYCAATTRSHVWFESLYEKAALMRIDRDAAVVGVSAQPMWIHWQVDGPRCRPRARGLVLVPGRHARLTAPDRSTAPRTTVTATRGATRDLAMSSLPTAGDARS